VSDCVSIIIIQWANEVKIKRETSQEIPYNPAERRRGFPTNEMQPGDLTLYVFRATDIHK
jgi:hypothetical protein